MIKDTRKIIEIFYFNSFQQILNTLDWIKSEVFYANQLFIFINRAVNS